MSILIRNAKVMDSNGKLTLTDILTSEGSIQAVGRSISSSAEETVDAGGRLVTPGLIDVHVHLREPGYEYKETIASGSQAAARGGFTTICAMPNVEPVPDTADHLKAILDKVKQDACVKVKQYAPITSQLISHEQTDMASLQEAGAFAFTNDGVGVQSAKTMYLAMQEAARLKASIVAHTEDDSLLFKGVMHEGKRSQELGLPGMSQLTESTQIARDVLLAEATGVHYHVCHVSAKESVRVIRDAKKAGINVTAEVTPHHLLLTDEDIPCDTSLYKMNPPLRGQEDQAALLEALKDGTIDMIATDHAPHSTVEKSGSMIGSPFGIVGSETAFSLLYTYLVQPGHLSLKELIEKLTVEPARVFKLSGGEVAVGAPADLACFDLERETLIQKNSLLSKSANTPFLNWTVKGQTVFTMVDGKIVYEEVPHE